MNVKKLSLPTVFLTHPFELCIAISVILMGMRASLTERDLSAGVERAVGEYMSMAWQALTILGGVVTLIALLSRARNNTRRTRVIINAVERAGLYLIATGSSVYVVVISFLSASSSGYVIGIMTAVTVACILQAAAIRRADRIILKNALIDEMT